MENRYGDEYTGSYIPRGPPSYSESNPPHLGSYSGSVPRGPPSLAGSFQRPLERNEKELDDDRSQQSKDMSRYPRDNRGDYTQYSDRGSQRPDNDRYYNDRPPMEPLRSRSPYDDDRYGRDSYDDRGSYRRDPYDDRRDPYYDDRGKDPYYDDRRYDEKSDSYNGKPYRDDQGSYRQDSGSYRDKYDDRPPRGPPNYDSEDTEGPVHIPPPNTPASLIPSYTSPHRASPVHNTSPRSLHRNDSRSYEFTPNQTAERFFERADSYNYPTSYPESPDIQSPPTGYGFGSTSNSPQSPSSKLPPKSPGSRASGSVFRANSPPANSPLTSPGLRSTGHARSGSGGRSYNTPRDPSVRSSSKPLSGGRDYDDEYDSRGDTRPRLPPENGTADVDDVRLNERDQNPRYAAQSGNVELSYAPPDAKAKKKPVLKELKPKVIKEKWKQKPARERRKYCGLFTCLILTLICVIVVPMAIYVRLWHKLTWDDIRNLQVQPRNLKWGQHGQHVYYRDFSNNIIEVNLVNHTQKPIFTFEQWNKVEFDDFEVTGPNRTLILAKNNGISYLHLNFVSLYKYNLNVTDNRGREPQMFVENVVHWSIASHATEDRLVVVTQDDNKCFNIRLHELGPKTITLKKIGELSTTPNIMNGVLTYMYSEEFFGRSSQGFWISQNGDYLVYMITDTTNVNTVSVQSPTNPDQKITYEYPTVQNSRNPIVRLRLYDILRGKIITGADEALNPLGKQDREYITSVSFPNAKKLLVEFMNREQTRATTEECTLNLSPTCENLRVLRRNSHMGWLPRYPAVAFPAQEDLETQQYYVLRPRVDKQFNFTHLHKYETTNDPNRKIAITTGEYAVTELIGNDETRKHVLYVRTEVLNPTHERTASTRKRMLYMYNESAVGDNQHTCISCLEPEGRCDVATASIDSSMTWYQLFCLGPGVPYVRVKKFSDPNYNVYSDDQANIQYQDPSKQAQLLQKKSPWTQYTQVELDKNTNIYVAIKKIFPLYYVKHANILKYPLLILVDPYPDGNMATMKYKLDLAQWLATSKDCVVAYMDVKGTPGRGLAFHHWPYRDLEKLVNKAEQAIRDIKMYWHVNDNKVAIMGEKLGGWLALKMMQRQPDWFQASIAVNPVFSFDNYLQAYSERYLDKYSSDTQAMYTKAAVNFNDFTSQMKKKTAIFYDARNYEVPHTFQTIDLFLKKETSNSGYIDFADFTMFDIFSIENSTKYEVLNDVFLDVGPNITQFLETSPHSIF